MKRKFIACISTLIFIGIMAGSRSASAQTYSGYLKLDDVAMKGPDSLHVTLTVPEGAYVRDTVFVTRKEARDMRKMGEGKAYYATPWMFAAKTNLLSDALVIPYGGVEVQLFDRLSFDLSGWFTKWNMLYPNDQTKVYGFSPELRLWFAGGAMKKGAFVGLHGNVCWYTLEWKDADGNRIIYQNGIDDLYDPGTKNPAWSAGFTFGYLLPLDRREHWNLEFYMGMGYAAYNQKRIYPVDNGGSYYKFEENNSFGVTKIGINLTYSFSLRRVRPKY